jgi:predicted DNA-binding protein
MNEKKDAFVIARVPQELKDKLKKEAKDKVKKESDIIREMLVKRYGKCG